MPAAETPVAYLGIDVGKSSHSACALDAGGGVAFRAELANRPDDIDRVLERAGSGALVVVDQKRNIGALVLARAHAHGNPCGGHAFVAGPCPVSYADWKFPKKVQSG